MACLRLRRLRYLTALLEGGPTILLAMLEHTWEVTKTKNGWAAQLPADFQWVARHLVKDEEDAIAHRTVQDWIDHIQHEPK
eukprot:2268617-Pyramimonas_sp.AAC.1